jgi:hypothetical protein
MMVPAQQLLVPLQLPFGGDVSLSSRCEAAWFFSRSAQRQEEGHRRSKAASEETALLVANSVMSEVNDYGDQP